MNVNDQFQYLNIGLPDHIQRLKTFGDFPEAVRRIDRLLSSGGGSEGFRACLRVQREIMLRLPEDYPYTFDEAAAFGRTQAPDFTARELRELEEQGRIDWIYINGVPHYFNRFFENLCETDPSYAARAGAAEAGDFSVFAQRHELFAKLRKNGTIAHRIRCRASVRIKDEYFHPGERVLVHLPVPARCEEQSEIRIDRVFPESGRPDVLDAPQRTVAWEETMAENHPFEVEYTYVYRGRYTDLWSARADPDQPDFFTGELPPHITFTPYVRDLARTLTQDAGDSLERARRFYDFVTQNVKYSYSRAYFGLENIAETCARNLAGDCGIQAMLFIALCRCAGIPARWESGLSTTPDSCGAHDWAKVYAAPLGWFPVDLSRGGAAFARGDEELRRYYFGNLEGLRMVANSTIQAAFGVPKRHWRADPYDNQLGEIETETRGLRYSEFLRSKEVLECEEL